MDNSAIFNTRATGIIRNRFDAIGASYRWIEHEETITSVQSAQARAQAVGVPVCGAKALLIRAGDAFHVLVLPGDARLDSKAARKRPEIGKFSFATTDELATLTGGLKPGSLPPFAGSVFPEISHLFVDSALGLHETIGFNVCSLRHSLIVAYRDYIQVASPTAIFPFSC